MCYNNVRSIPSEGKYIITNAEILSYNSRSPLKRKLRRLVAARVARSLQHNEGVSLNVFELWPFASKGNTEYDEHMRDKFRENVEGQLGHPIRLTWHRVGVVSKGKKLEGEMSEITAVRLSKSNTP